MVLMFEFDLNHRLIYDPKTKKSSSPDGVNITVPGFGGTESVEWIDPSHLPFGMLSSVLCIKCLPSAFVWQLNKTCQLLSVADQSKEICFTA